MPDDLITRKAAEALPCNCGTTLLNKLGGGHRHDCPARLRPAVKAAMRELAGAVVEEMVDAADLPVRIYKTDRAMQIQPDIVQAMRQRAKERGWIV